MSLMTKIFEKIKIRMGLVSVRELATTLENLESQISAKVEIRLCQLEGGLRELEGEFKDIRACLQLLCRAAFSPALLHDDFVSREPGLVVLSYEEQLSALKVLEPLAFPMWWECFEAGRREYERTHEGNLSTADHPAANAFGEFVVRYARGNVLDIGCGPQLVPSYLRLTIGKAGVQINGVEPLPSDHPFPCYRGFAEFLPWGSNTLDAVVCGTSLDHCLSLEKALEEIHRVLKVGGVFLIWVGFVPGAKEYDPKLPGLVPLDDYHLFHFDRRWFEALLLNKFGPHFDFVNQDGVSHFYAFRKKANRLSLSSENKAWLDSFMERNARAPRVLHIGNIANNAYNNAKLLNEAGFDCDVLCYDFYHIMACPEWEDADFIGAFADDFRPEWFGLNLGSFQRPRWFSQGPQLLAIEYLYSRRSGLQVADKLWQRLLVESNCSVPNKDSDSNCDTKTETEIEVGESVSNGFVNTFRSEFGDREDQLEASDMGPYLWVLPYMRRLFACYDYIIGYSDDPVWPMLCGSPYFAFEHGTIRDIPYENNVRGQLTALAYRMAKHVFVTNFDCKASADYLAPGRYTLINHPYDEDHGLAVTGSQTMRTELMDELQSTFICFHPTRHDWVAGTGYADKQNDTFLRAFAELRASGVTVGLICCEWGANVEESKRLLNESGCSQFVRWIPPQAITPFERLCLSSDIVVDQFKLGAFGGVVFKAMAVGTPILTFLDVERLSKQYPVCPPVLNCRTQEEIVRAIRGMLNSPSQLKALGVASREWIKKYHAKEQVVNAQVDQFRCHMPNSESESRTID